MEQAIARWFGERAGEFTAPPECFTFMEGEVIAFDADAATMSARFPIRPGYLNPYGVMQGGFTAAAIDNTIGPLSMMSAPASVTRTIEVTYSRPVLPSMDTITVEARRGPRDGRRITFTAEVRAPDGTRLARATAVHVVMAAAETRPGERETPTGG